jgi:chemotaxis protein MotA
MVPGRGVRRFMDIATVIGLVGGLAVLYGAVFLEGSGIMQFANLLATVVVVGGAGMAVLMRYPLGTFISSTIFSLKAAFMFHHTSTRELIDQLRSLAEIVRQQGPLGLEQVQIDNPFLAKGVQMVADGFSAEAIRQSLERERDLQYERLEEGHKIFKALGEAAPGLGMVGTLIGLISMFAHMDDPKKIGPGMAIALTTTLYGAIVANVIALPLSDKLANRAADEANHCTLIIDAILMIRENTSPKLVVEQLLSYLPLHSREVDEERKAA